MKELFTLTEKTDPADYAKAFAAMQLERQDLGCDEQITVDCDNDEYEIVDPWFNPYTHKELSDKEADEVYGRDAVEKFILESSESSTLLLVAEQLDNGQTGYLTETSYSDGIKGYSVVYQDGSVTYKTLEEAQKALMRLPD